MHDILIFIVIGVIIAFQIYFFGKNSITIKKYKESLSQVEDLEVVADKAIDDDGQVEFLDENENIEDHYTSYKENIEAKTITVK